MIRIDDKTKCCGCSACLNICPKKCIEMKSDEEGFVYPVVKEDSCIHCGLCEKVCPIKNEVKLPTASKAAYVVQSMDDSVLIESTSGGFSDELYKFVLASGGYVCGCIYDKEWMPHHVITNNIKDLPLFRSSKYAQSRLDGGVFSQIKELLGNEKTVCFVGTPCQVAGLKNYLMRDYEKLITVDLVCRSIPSPLLLKEYLSWQEDRYQSKIELLNCRSKTYGYHNGSLIINFQNGKRYSGSNRVDPFMKAFHNDICSRPSCYDCVFKTPTRCSDFTVFDCWRPESLNAQITDNNKGYSNVIIHTEKGVEIFNALKGICSYETGAKKMFCYTGSMESRSVSKPRERDCFYYELNQYGFSATVNKYVDISVKDRFIERMKYILYKLGVLRLILSIKNKLTKV